MKSKQNLKNFCLKIMTVAVSVFAISGVSYILAMPDETTAVHIKDSEVKNSTLIIGSHLIYLTSLNDSIYEIANKSAEEYNQHNIYYKSEIAGGIWYEISDASALSDITTEGVVVDKREIEELWLTHHTKSDGITYDLLTGKSKSVFDIENPYDLENMSELEPIKLQYDYLLQLEDKSETNERDILYIEEVYSKDRETDETKLLDESLKALQKYYENLVQADAESSWKDIVTGVMEQVDAARRVVVLTALNETELQKMNEVIGREFVYIQGEITGDFVMSEERQKKAKEAADAERAKIQAELDAEKESLETLRTYVDTKAKEAENELLAQQIREFYAEELRAKEEAVADLESNAQARIEAAEKGAIESVMNAKRDRVEKFVPNKDLIDSIGEAMSNVQESYTTYSAKMLEEGTTVLSKTEHRLKQDLITYAKSNDYTKCDEVVVKLLNLQNVNNGITSNDSSERDMIESELLGAAEQAYKDSLGAGESEEYKMLSSMASAATKANVLKKQMNETEIVRNELQFIQQALVNRMTQKDVSAYMTEQLNNIDALQEVIKADAFETYATASLEQYKDWTKEMLSNIQNASGDNEMSSLMNQKDELQTELMTALDKNQLGEAKKIQAEIEAIDQAIADLEKELNAILNSGQATEEEKALAASKLSAGSSLKVLQDMKAKALEEIREGNLEGVDNIIDGIGALGQTQPEGTLAALKDIYQELVNQELMNGGSNALNDLLGKVEGVTQDQMDYFFGNLSEDDFDKLIQSYFGEDEITDNEEAVILVGLDKYAQQTGSTNAKDLLETYGKVALNDGNPNVFDVYNGYEGLAYEYIPTDKLAQVIGYRYIFDNSYKSVTLQKGSQYYKFAAFSNIMQKGNSEIEMNKTAVFEGVIYIPIDVVEEQFGLTVQTLADTSFGVILSEQMQGQADEFVDYLLEAGGGF